MGIGFLKNMFGDFGFTYQTTYGEGQDEDTVRPDLSWYQSNWLKRDVEKKMGQPLYSGFTESHLRDIYKLFYHKNPTVELKEDKYWWYDIMRGVDNRLLKIFTNKRENYSQMVAANILQELMMAAASEDQKQGEQGAWQEQVKKDNELLKSQLPPDPSGQGEGEGAGGEGEQQEGQGGGQGEGEGQGQQDQQQGQGGGQGNQGQQPQDGQGKDQGSGENGQQGESQSQQAGGSGVSKDWSNVQLPKHSMTHRMKQAVDTGVNNAIEQIENYLDAADKLGCSMNDYDPVQLGELIEMMNDLNMDKSFIQKFVKTSVEKFKESLYGKEFIVEESLLDSDVIEDLPECYELLYDEFIPDVTITETRRSMTFDIYIDKSGSMDGFDLTIAKVLAAKMNSLKMLKNVYAFDGTIHEVEKEGLLSISPGGGTNIDLVLEHINQKTHHPSIIITDMQDRIEVDCNKAYLLSVNPNYMSNSRDSGSLANFIKDGRTCLYYDNKFYDGAAVKKRMESGEGF